MKSKQFCSVCKQWLEMETVPTGDGEEDDGVVWFRCPRCQGFLPKLRSALDESAPGAPDDAPDDPAAAEPPAAEPDPVVTEDKDGAADDDLPWDSPADMMAAREEGGAATLPGLETDADTDGEIPAAVEPEEEATAETATEGEPAEPIAEYAALLAVADVASAVPYRPWESYEVGQCVHHLAWDDCGVVVAKEDLPGGRYIIKCYFEEAGVVRLIEKAAR